MAMSVATDSVDRASLEKLLEREESRFIDQHPRSRAMAERAQGALVGGVPMRWMGRWPGAFPVYFAEAQGASLLDVDGNRYADFCLGDTAAMAGHSPPPVVRAIARRADRGLAAMLPVEDAIRAGEQLAGRFGLPAWQFTLTATDANRVAIRLARELTRRPRILVFNGCYHGTVDETYATLSEGRVVQRSSNIGAPVDPALTTRVVEFNDVAALEAELSHGDVACVLAEPALTNIGIVLPETGFHDALRKLTRAAGTLLVLDETHTFCAGPGGMTAAKGLEPDMVTIGKAIGGGVPVGAYGLSADIVDGLGRRDRLRYRGPDGIGGTMAANALSMAAARATLEEVLTPDAFRRTTTLADRLVSGVEELVNALQLPWHVVQIGCRAEYRYAGSPPRNGSEAVAGIDRQVDRFLHIFALNRGVLLTPFHSMALISPSTTAQDVDRHTTVLEEAAGELTRKAIER